MTMTTQPQEEPTLTPEDIREEATARAEPQPVQHTPSPHMDASKGRAARRKVARARSGRHQDAENAVGEDTDGGQEPNAGQRQEDSQDSKPQELLGVDLGGHSRCVVSSRLSNTLEAGFCAEAVSEPLERGRPEVFTDQGSQFTSQEFTQVLQDRGVKISMDGKGRYADNIFVERLWHTVKYEEVYLKAYASAGEARRELGAYFRFYNDHRPHQALGYRTPGEVFSEATALREEESTVGRWSPEADVVSYAGAPGLSLNSATILSN